MRYSTNRYGRIIRQIIAVLLISLLTVLTLTSSTASISAQAPDVTIRLKSREFVPTPGVEQAVLIQQQDASPVERLHVLMQFSQIPSEIERAALENAGVNLLAYVPANTWFVSIPRDLSLQTSQALSNVRWIGAIQPQDRTAPALQSGNVSQYAVNDDGSVNLDIRFFRDVDNAAILQTLTRYGAIIEDKVPDLKRFAIRVNPQAITSLANEDTVQWITTAAPPKTTDNDGSRAQTNVDIIQAGPYNLSGAGVNLGEWDGGLVDTHPDFSGRLTAVDTGASVSSHATHVAGTMAGDGTNSGGALRGMAPAADIFSYFWDNPITDHNGAINTYNIDLSQNSWGYLISSAAGNCSLYGNYDFASPDYDEIVTGLYGKRISIVFSVGNERDDGDCGMSTIFPFLNYGNVGPLKTAKNVIAVGATNSNNDTMTSFSSWGPVDDGRLKPEIVAPGCESGGYINSTLPGGGYGGPGWCGTSMAAPAVSGIIGLLIEQYRTTFGGVDPLPSTLKAILVQTAIDLDDSTSYYNPGPDYASGYGRVDAQVAADLIIAQNVTEDQIGQGQTDVFPVTVPANTPSFKVTLAWDDEPGTVNANPTLVNNLDLVLIDPNGVVYSPWVLDPANPSNNAATGTDDRNNLEQVLVNNPLAGVWQVQVSGTTIPTGLQSYSLAGLAAASPPGNVGPLVYDSHTIDDDNNGNSSGNDDSIINPGETIELFVDLRNDGTDTAITPQAIISTNSPYVTFIFNTSSGYNDIAGNGGIGTNLSDFDFEVSANTPVGHVIQFDLSLSASNGGPWSDSFTVTVGGNNASSVALISDQTELQAITSILDEMNLTYDTFDNNWDGVQGLYTSDYNLLSGYDVVVWYASGNGAGRLITQQEHDALELYLQSGGRLLATGYDTLGSPTDSLLADLVRSSSDGDGPFRFDYTISNDNHPITDGPFGAFPAGTPILAATSDHDQAEADTGLGALTIAELGDGHDKIIATELASSGIVVYWNGNENVADWVGALTTALGEGHEQKRDVAGQPLGQATQLQMPHSLKRPTPQGDGSYISAGVQSDTSPPPLSEATANEFLRPLGPIPQSVTVINFDDVAAPCAFIDTTALRNAYQAQGVTFDGPGGNDGGAILDECSNFGVSGHSFPNFLAFNASTGLSDGGTPTDPETITFSPAVSFVQINAGSGLPGDQGQLLTMEAFDVNNNSLGSDTITLDAVVQPLSIAATGIARVVISSPAARFILDDLIFDTETGSGVGPNAALFKNTMAWLTDVPNVIDPHEPNDSPADCTQIFFDIALTDPLINPPGDWDYFCFNGTSGQTIAADIDAWEVGSALDPVLTLFDTDGTTVLTENDDFNGLDSYLEYTLPGNGLYYLRVRSFAHPCCGGPDHTYSLLLTNITAALPLPFFDDMEAGINGWSADGLWHQVEDGVSPYPNSLSPTHSWWYGQDATGDYDTGGANSGDLTSPSLQIPAGTSATLSFWNWYETEPILSPQTIYFDIYHDTDTDDNISGGLYTEWADLLTSGGYTVLEYNQLIDSVTLSGHDVLALFDPEVPLSAAEITAINDFMQTGGRVVVLGEHNDIGGANTVLNALTTNHGITFNTDIVEDSTNNDGSDEWPLITSFANHSLVRNVDTVVLYASSSLSLAGAAIPLATGDADAITTGFTAQGAEIAKAGEDGDENSIDVNSSRRDPLAITPGAPIVVAYAPVGDGGLIAIGDSGLWADDNPDGDSIISIDEYDNLQLARQIFGQEIDSSTWDQKWVQISVDGGPFQDIFQVTGGPMNAWHEINVDLSAYADSVIRLRLHFDTIDGVFNDFRGWYIDDFLVEAVTDPAPGPLAYSDHIIDDDALGQSVGDDDGIADPGETIEMYVEITNQGSVEATNVEVCLSEDSVFVNGFLFNDCASYGNVPGGAAVLNSSDYDFTIDSTAPCGHVIHFTADISADNGGPWSSSFDVVVCGGVQPPGPVIYFDHQIDDDNFGESVGNNDGIPNPGETIELYVELLNVGQGTATNVNGSLEEGSVYVNGFLFNTNSNYGDISGGGSAINTNDFDFTIDPLTPHQTVIPFTITASAANGGPWTDTFELVVSDPPPGPSLYLEPANQEVSLTGGSFIANVMINNATDLGAFEFDLVYNPTIVHVSNVVLGDFLGSTGRTPTETGPNIDNGIGRTSYGAFTLGNGPGPNGSGLLATITLTPIQAGDSDLILENLQLADTDLPPTAIIPSSNDGHVTVTDRFFADVDDDGDVDIFDIQTVVAYFGCTSTDPCYDPIYDLDKDGDVDIIDIQIVACYWGWPNGDFSTCFTPTATARTVSQTEAKVSLQSDVSHIETIGDRFAVTVDVTNVDNLGSFEFELHYDPNIVTVDSVTLGDFLGSTSRTVFEVPATIDNAAGKVTYGAVTHGVGNGPAGAGELAIIHLTSHAQGDMVLNLQGIQVADPNAIQISVTMGQMPHQIYLPVLLNLNK